MNRALQIIRAYEQGVIYPSTNNKKVYLRAKKLISKSK